MGVAVRLLGPPAVQVDGAPVPGPRGRKAWALLAFLVLAPAPVPRQRLCALLFADAEDPQAALRWNLSELRRVLADPALLRGDPLRPLAGMVQADIESLTRASVGRDLEPELANELLEGLAFPSCPGFEVWLEAERRHLRRAGQALLREGALGRLGRGDPAGAAVLAARLVQADPYAEASQALLVRALAAAGDGVGAARQVAACRELFRREVGVEAGPALAAAAATMTDRSVASPAGGRPGVVAQLEAGEAALGAGAVEAGLQCLRRAVADAHDLGEQELQARALLALGTALVHSVRGHDEEGAAALHRALALAPADVPIVQAAARELGHVEFLAGRYGRVEPWLLQAERAAGDDAAARAAVLVVRGSTASDTGRYQHALASLTEAVNTTPDDRRASYALSMLGRAHVLRGALVDAERVLQRSLALAQRHSWASFVPWPESFLAEVDLRRGDVAKAEQRLEHAFAMGCHIADPCWEGVSARGLGLVRAARGDAQGAVALLLDARARALRVADAYLWLDAYVLDALCGVAVQHRLPEAEAWAHELSRLASSTGMRELAVRGLSHRARLGDAAAGAAAAAAVGEIDNPALQELVLTCA